MHKTLVILTLASAVLSAADLPTEWIDADTGHRVIRLSREDGTQSQEADRHHGRRRHIDHHPGHPRD